MMFTELPFTTYPGGRREQLKLRPGWNTRHADGPEFIRTTGLKNCAYCGLDLTNRFEDWLTVVLDHVVRVSVCKKMGLKIDWFWDYTNAVLACGACNGFCNRYRLEVNCSMPVTPLEFFERPDRIFAERKELILNRRAEEREHFDKKPWNPIHFRVGTLPDLAPPK